MHPDCKSKTTLCSIKPKGTSRMTKKQHTTEEKKTTFLYSRCSI